MHVQFLIDFKDDLKKSISSDLEKTLDSFFNILNEESKLKNELVHLKSRFNIVKSDSLKGLMDFDTRMIQTNRVMDGSLQLIERMTYPDLDPDFSPELKEAIESYEKSVEKNELSYAQPIAESVVPKATIAPATMQPSNPEMAAPEKKSTLVNFAEFEIFVTQYNFALKCFPKIYRRAREISIRRDLKAANEFHALIVPHLPAFQETYSLFDPIRDNIRTIRLDQKNAISYLKYQGINDMISNLKVDDLSLLMDQLPKLLALHKELKASNLI